MASDSNVPKAEKAKAEKPQVEKPKVEKQPKPNPKKEAVSQVKKFDKFKKKGK